MTLYINIHTLHIVVYVLANNLCVMIVISMATIVTSALQTLTLYELLKNFRVFSHLFKIFDNNNICMRMF